MRRSTDKLEKLQEEQEKQQFCGNCNKAWAYATVATVFVNFYECIN